MAGVKINNYGSGNNNLDNLMVSTDTQRRGYHAASLTEWTNTTTIPKIAKGSVIEIGGSVVEFQADETITGSIATGDNYISINPSTYVATWTATPPVWNDEYQGFYDTTNRILSFRVVKDGTSYKKYEIIYKNGNISIGDDLYVSGFIKGIRLESFLLNNSTTTEAQLYDFIYERVEGIDGSYFCGGSIRSTSGGDGAVTGCSLVGTNASVSFIDAFSGFSSAVGAREGNATIVTNDGEILM